MSSGGWPSWQWSLESVFGSRISVVCFPCTLLPGEQFCTHSSLPCSCLGGSQVWMEASESMSPANSSSFKLCVVCFADSSKKLTNAQPSAASLSSCSLSLLKCESSQREHKTNEDSPLQLYKTGVGSVPLPALPESPHLICVMLPQNRYPVN